MFLFCRNHLCVCVRVIEYLLLSAATHNDHEDPYPSLSDYHDYEPNLEFDDTELQHATVTSGKGGMPCLSYIAPLHFAVDV